MKTLSLMGVLLYLITTGNLVNAQNVGINTTGATPSVNAILDLNNGNNSQNLGVIIPNVTLGASLTTFSPPIANAANQNGKSDIGMLVYNSVATNQPIGLYYWNGSTWVGFGFGTSTQTKTIDLALSSENLGSNGGACQFLSSGGQVNNNISNWTPTTAIPAQDIVTVAGNAYMAFAATTLFNVTLQGWVSKQSANSITNNPTVYLVKYSLGSGPLLLASTVAGTSLASITIPMAGVGNSNAVQSAYSFTFNIGTVTLAAGDVIIFWLQNNDTGNHTFQASAQFQFQ